MGARVGIIGVLFATAVALLALAPVWGEGGGTFEKTPARTPQATATIGPLPEIFMTFDGRRYRLVNVESAAAVLQGEAVLAGETEDIDVDHEGPVQVYRATEGHMLYTFPTGDAGLQARGVSLPDRCGRCGIRLEWAPV